MFTRQHYKKLAKAIRSHKDDKERKLIARFLSDFFKEDNSFFDRDLWHDACSQEGTSRSIERKRHVT